MSKIFSCNFCFFLATSSGVPNNSPFILGQYPDLLSGLCRLCSEQCETCIPGRAHACLTCGKSRLGRQLYLKKDRCVLDVNCGSGYFANKTSGMCQFCPYSCSACNGDRNCESCHINMSEERCMHKCPSGTFRDNERR